jgi:hypothetical protein
MHLILITRQDDMTQLLNLHLTVDLRFVYLLTDQHLWIGIYSQDVCVKYGQIKYQWYF